MDEIRGDIQPNYGRRKFVKILIIIIVVILLIIAGWVIYQALKKASEDIADTASSSDLEILEAALIENESVQIIVQRNSKKGDLVGINFNISDGDSFTIIRVNTTMQKKDNETFVFSLDELNLITFLSVSIAPIYLIEEGEEIIEVVSETTDTTTTISSGGGGGGSGTTDNGDAPVTPTCSDGIQNQDETGIDCGGSCNACFTGTTYYISMSGSDSNDGTTTNAPWKTIAKINSETFSPGDAILFKRGDTWHETLTIDSSGNSTSPITFSAYGSGDKPVITGFTTITGWTNEGGGIYSKIVSCDSKPNVVAVDGVNTARGRWPTTGWRTIDSHVGTTSLTDADLNSDVTDWTGGEVVIRKNHWIFDRCLITNHTSQTLTYSSPSSYNASDGYGYFIQDNIKTLDAFGEWYYDDVTSKFYMYFGVGVNPNNHVVKVSTLNKDIYLASKNYVTFDNLLVEGANSINLHMATGTNITIQNCHIRLSGGYAISTTAVTYCNVLNNTIENCNEGGAKFGGSGNSGIYVADNLIQNITMLQGMGKSGDGGWVGLSMSGTIGNAKNIAEYNRLLNHGYIPMVMVGKNIIYRYNYINNYCLIKDDCGGIYNAFNQEVGKEIYHNIILNGIGNPGGTPGFLSIPTGAHGIYSDQSTSYTEIYNNVVFNVTTFGIYARNMKHSSIHDNLVFDSSQGQLQFMEDFNIQEVENVSIYNNLLVSANPNQKIFSTNVGSAFSSSFEEFLVKFEMNNNHYVFPFENGIEFYHNYVDAGVYSTKILGFNGWKTFSGKDSDSTKSSTILSEYTINGLESNIINNGEFTSNINGVSKAWADGKLQIVWDNTNKIEEGSCKVSYSDAPTTINIGHINLAVTTGFSSYKNYILRYSTLGSTTNGALVPSLLEYNSPWRTLTENSPRTLLNNNLIDNEVLIRNPVTQPNFTLVFSTNYVDGTFYIDKIRMYEADVTIHDNFHFEHNAAKTSKYTTLNFNDYTYKDMYDNVVTSNQIIEPYSGIVLFKFLR